jgi:hypothetical protein
MTVRFFEFYEMVMDRDNNALFFMFRSPYKWMTFDRCTFNIANPAFFTIEGTNVRMINSVINMTITSTIT